MRGTRCVLGHGQGASTKGDPAQGYPRRRGWMQQEGCKASEHIPCGSSRVCEASGGAGSTDFGSALMVCISVLQGHHGTVHHPHRADRGGGDPTQPDGKSQQEGAAAALLPGLAHGLGMGPGAWGCSTHCHATSRAETVLVGCQQGSAGAGLGSLRSCPRSQAQ